MRLRIAALCSAGLIVSIGTAPSQIVINEIMQNPEFTGDTDGEWFELYNAGDQPVDLTGWTIRDEASNSHIISGGSPLVIQPGAFLVLGRNDDPLLNGNVPVDYAYGTSITLGNGTDQIILEDQDGIEQDRVAYDDGATFPDPSGASMELIHPDVDNAIGTHWLEAATSWDGHDRGTPGGANSQLDTIPPSLVFVDVVTSELLRVTFSEEVDSSSAANALNYTISPGIGAPFTAVRDSADRTIVSLVTPPLTEGVVYLLTTAGISDLAGNPGEDSIAFQISPPIQPGDVIVTEIMNDPSAVNDSDGEWFEVFNKREVPVDLAGWEVSDGGSNSFTVQSSFIIPAHGFGLFVVNDDSSSNGGLQNDLMYDWGSSSTFTLGNTGDAIILSTGSVVIDSVRYDGGPVWPDPTGASMGLSDFSLENNDGTNWTIASLREPFFDGAGGDLGSPGTLGVNQSFGSSGDTAVSGTLLIPAEQLPIPAEGDTVDLTVLVRNNSSRELAADLWVDMLRPGIAARKVVVNPRLVSLAAGDSLLRLRLLRIPVFGPTGLYELVLHIGAYPDSSGVTDSLRFEKLAPPSAASASDLAGLPRGSDLMQNFPNPFNSSVSIHYALEEDTWVTLAIFDVLGREIRRLVHEFQEAGVRSVHWHGEDQRGAPVGSGVYVYRLSLGPMSFTKKMLLLR